MFIIHTGINEDNSNLHSIVYGTDMTWEEFKDYIIDGNEAKEILVNNERHLEVKFISESSNRVSIINYGMITDEEFVTPVGFWLSKNKDTTTNKTILKLLNK